MGIQTTTINGKLQKYDDTKYKVAYVGSEKKLVPIYTDTTNADNASREAAQTENAQKRADKTNKPQSKFVQGINNTLQGASRASAYAGAATAKAQGINDPQAGHYAQQAALSEAQAAKMRTDEQLARQEAYRNSGDRALTESAKMAEASSAAKVRAFMKNGGSSALGSAAGAEAGKKAADVDPMQNTMAIKQQGYNRQDTATQLGQQAATYQSGAEAQRANATESGELARQNAVANAEKQRAAQAQAEQDAEARRLQNERIAAETAKLKKESANIESSTQKTNVENAQNQLNATQNLASKDKLDYILNTNNTDQASMTNLFWAWNEYAKEDGTAADEYMDNIIIPRIGKGSEAARHIYSAWQRANQGTPNYDNANRIMYDRLISDERMKNILSPAGRTLLHLYKGRTR